MCVVLASSPSNIWCNSVKTFKIEHANKQKDTKTEIITLNKQGVPHHVRSSIGLNYDFRDLSENVRRMNHFEKFIKANMRIFLWKMLAFSGILGLFWR